MITTPFRKKILSLRTRVFFVIFTFLFSTISIPNHAYAFIPQLVHDPINNISGVATAGSSAGLQIKEYTLDPLAYAVSKVALHSLTKSVVNWINTGFNGSPAFVQDLNQTLLNVGDAEATRFIDQFVNSGSLQDIPWKDDIAQTVLSGYLRSSSNDGFALDNPYTLNQVSEDPQAFVNGDWSKGGLDAWMSVVLNDANSPLGLRHVVQNTLNSRVGGAKDAKNTELSWSNGFNSFRGKCPAASSGTFTGGGGNTGGALSFSSDAALAKPPTLLSTSDTCAGQPILTPGALIAQSANKYLVDSGVDQYVSADEISEVVNALMGQLIGNVLGGGGLVGVSSPASGGGASYINRAADPNQTLNAASSLSLSQSFLTTIGNQEAQLVQYKNSWTTISDAASSAKTALAGSSCSSVDTTLSQAGIAVASATSAIASLDAIKAQLTSSVANDPTSQSAQVAAATTAYQQLQSSGSLPTANDILYANTESQDRQADSTNGVTASLYTQMLQIASSKICSL